MKNKIILLASFLILLFSEFKSQNDVTFVNTWGCDVVINYEMRTTNCGVCAAGTLTLIATTSQTLPKCPGYIDMCINIVTVDGCTPSPAVHLHDGACHLPIISATGVGVQGCCNAASWTADWDITTDTFSFY